MNNAIELIGYYGSDETHACSAWTSTNRDLTEEKRSRIPAMLESLASNGHETPFEKSSLHFLVTSDIASHIHMLKHRIAVSINGESARYKEIKEDRFYIPSDWPEEWQNILQEYTQKGLELYHLACKSLQEHHGLDRKRIKETARFFRGYNTQIECDIMFNFRSFVHFQRLRNTSHAQKEIRDIAVTMLDLVKNIEGNPFQYTLKAFNL
jgi:flavin-dependent thymidylate synthase